MICDIKEFYLFIQPGRTVVSPVYTISLAKATRVFRACVQCVRMSNKFSSFAWVRCWFEILSGSWIERRGGFGRLVFRVFRLSGSDSDSFRCVLCGVVILIFVRGSFAFFFAPGYGRLLHFRYSEHGVPRLWFACLSSSYWPCVHQIRALLNILFESIFICLFIPEREYMR